MSAAAAYHVGQHVGFVDRREQRLELPLPRVWFILRVQAGRDRKVMDQLRAREISAVSLSIVRSIERSSGNEARRPHLGKMRVSAFLPGLIFIPDFETANPAFTGIDYVDRWLEITTAGAAIAGDGRRNEIVNRYGQAVSSRRQIATLSVEDMRTLRDIEAAMNTPRGERKKAFDKLVRITGGPFAGMIGKIERLDSRGRLKVFIAALMRGVSATLNETQVEPV